MPIVIKDYTWKQTDEKIIVKVPLKGADTSKADIFTCDNLIKVHCPPFLFEVCLRDIINEENSICRVSANEIIFELKKNERGPWDVLEAPLTKAEIVAVKKRAIELSMEKIKAKREAREAKKQEIKSLGVQNQISLDTKERNKIDALRENEKKIAMDEFEEWKQKQKIQNQNELVAKFTKNQKHESKGLWDKSSDQNEKPESDTATSSEEETSENKSNRKLSGIQSAEKYSTRKKIFDEPQGKQNTSLNKMPLNTQKNVQSKTPSPRNSGRIEVSFTPRAFPTPSRESKQLEENEWLQKQAEARRRSGFVIEDLRPEEHDPVWLKDKGDSFYKVGNYIGAISAYSHGIKLNPKLAALYSNRAAAHLAMGNLRRVVQDTTKALELLVPCVDMNANSRSLCHARRGAALCQLDIFQSGLVDLEEAFKLCPDKELEEDIKNIKAKMENPDFISEEEENNEIGVE